MDYQRTTFGTLQDVLDRIALLEWFMKHDEATSDEIAEWVRLKGII